MTRPSPDPGFGTDPFRMSFAAGTVFVEDVEFFFIFYKNLKFSEINYFQMLILDNKKIVFLYMSLSTNSTYYFEVLLFFYMYYYSLINKPFFNLPYK